MSPPVIMATVLPIYVFGKAPALLNTQAFFYQLVVLIFYNGGHITPNNAGLHLVNGDIEFA